LGEALLHQLGKKPPNAHGKSGGTIAPTTHLKAHGGESTALKKPETHGGIQSRLRKATPGSVYQRSKSEFHQKAAQKRRARKAVHDMSSHKAFGHAW